jgi:pimeloyl-ACP methyl ester carboxylesterase
MNRTVLAFALVLVSATAGAQGLNPYPCPTPATEFVDPMFSALPEATAFAGRYDGGMYQIEVPKKWNGELITYQHGAVTGSQVQVRVPDLRSHWIRGGYAWAASSFRCNSPLAGIGVVDTVLLADLFPRLTGQLAPTRTWAVGGSNGGGGVMLALRYYPTRFAGGFAMCPADMQVVDFRLAVAAAAEVIGDLDFRDAAALQRMEQVFGTPANYTVQGRQLASVQIELTGGPRPFAVEGLAERFAANVVGGVTNSATLAAATNQDTRYRIDRSLGLSADVLNARVRRLAPDLQQRTNREYHDAMPFDLRMQRPLLTIHGTGDLQVPITLERGFKRAADAAGTSSLLIQRIMRIAGHCRFSEQEQAEAFDDLVTWVVKKVRPEGDDVMRDLASAGRRFTRPIRPGDPGTVKVGRSARTR